MFYEADEVENVMEVILTCEDDNEYVYWVKLEAKPEDEDEYDWAIERARAHHLKLKLPECLFDTEDETFSVALEPFSREDSEFTWVD